MEAGLPVICTDFELWCEIIDRYKCGIYVKPGDLNDLTNAMRMILDDRVEAFKMGQNGRQAIIEKYNWDSEEKKYIELFHKLKQLKLRNMNSNKN